MRLPPSSIHFIPRLQPPELPKRLRFERSLSLFVHRSMDCMTAAVTAAAAATGGGSSKNQNRREGSDGCKGVAIHSQVMKIKQEIEEIKHPSLQHVEIRHISLRDFSSQRSRSRSPLGLSNRAISVGNA